MMIRPTRRPLFILLAVLRLAALRITLLGLAAWWCWSCGAWMRWLPGEDRPRLDALHPTFREEVDGVIAELEDQGWRVGVSSGWRSPERQEALYWIGQAGERLGQAPWTRVRGGESCHNQITGEGAPAAAAVDLAPIGEPTLARRAAFYQALGRAARARGLRWGGDFTHSNPTWARFDLGWDPAHVEDRALCASLRDGRATAAR